MSLQQFPSVKFHNWFQILSGAWHPDYQAVLERPLSLSRDLAWLHLSSRADFVKRINDQGSGISKHDKTVIDTLSSIFQCE